VLALRDSHWFSKPDNEEPLLAQYRYHGPLVSGHFDETKRVFIPTEPLTETPAAGQSLVFYKGDELVGGCIIEQ
jgi:tRNA U34 2-thiouridine synthase MnmA/TrmU